MSLPGPELPPTPSNEGKNRGWYTLRYFGRVEPGRAVQDGFRDRGLLAVIVITLLVLVAVFFLLSRL